MRRKSPRKKSRLARKIARKSKRKVKKRSKIVKSRKASRARIKITYKKSKGSRRSRKVRSRKGRSRKVRSRKVRSRKGRSRKVRSRKGRSRKVRSRKVRSRKGRSRKVRSRKGRSRKVRSRKGRSRKVKVLTKKKIKAILTVAKNIISTTKRRNELVEGYRGMNTKQKYKKLIEKIIKEIIDLDKEYFKTLFDKYPRTKVFLIDTAKPVIDKILLIRKFSNFRDKKLREEHKLFSKLDSDIKEVVIKEIEKEFLEEFKKNIYELEELGKKVERYYKEEHGNLDDHFLNFLPFLTDFLDIFFGNKPLKHSIYGTVYPYFHTELNNTTGIIDDKDAEVIAKALPSSNIRRLELEDNDIGEKGAEYIANALKKSKITWLSLLGNDIGDKGAEYIANALPNSKIQILNLSGCNIGDKGAEALAKILPKSILLIEILLNSNRIGDKGAIAIANALPNSKIRFLNLDDNNIDDGGKKLLNQLKKSNQDVLAD